MKGSNDGGDGDGGDGGGNNNGGGVKHHLPAFLRAVIAVLSGFVGIRKGAGANEDSRVIRPIHIIIAGVFLVAVFIAILLFAVKLALRG